MKAWEEIVRLRDRNELPEHLGASYFRKWASWAQKETTDRWVFLLIMTAMGTVFLTAMLTLPLLGGPVETYFERLLQFWKFSLSMCICATVLQLLGLSVYFFHLDPTLKRKEAECQMWLNNYESLLSRLNVRHDLFAKMEYDQQKIQAQLLVKKCGHELVLAERKHWPNSLAPEVIEARRFFQDTYTLCLYFHLIEDKGYGEYIKAVGGAPLVSQPEAV